MAQKKQQPLDPRDYEVEQSDTTELPIGSVDHNFILVEGEEKPQPVSLITAEEQERRELQRRFKKLRGYKPTTKNLDELRTMVADEEHRYGLKRDGII